MGRRAGRFGNPEGGVQAEAEMVGLCWGLSSQGQKWTLLLPSSVTSAAPSHLPWHPPPPPHLSQSKDWKIDESVYEAHNVANKTRRSAEQLGTSNGILFMSFSSWRCSHYRPDGTPSPSTPPVMLQCHTEGCALQPSWLGLGAGSWV